MCTAIESLSKGRNYKENLWLVSKEEMELNVKDPSMCTAIESLNKGEIMALLKKDVKGFGLSWEESYGFAQAVKVDDTIYVSGQLGLDDKGNMVGPPPLDDSGRIPDYSNMETQMRQTYANAKRILSQFGATLENVVEEVLYVLDMETAFAAAFPVRKEAYASKRPAVASTIVVTPRLSLPTQLIEIKFIAKVR